MWLNMHVKSLVDFCFAISTAQLGGSHSFKVLCRGETCRTSARTDHSRPCPAVEGRSYWGRFVSFNIIALPKERYSGQAYEAQLYSGILKEKLLRRMNNGHLSAHLLSLKDL